MQTKAAPRKSHRLVIIRGGFRPPGMELPSRQYAVAQSGYRVFVLVWRGRHSVTLVRGDLVLSEVLWEREVPIPEGDIIRTLASNGSPTCPCKVDFRGVRVVANAECERLDEQAYAATYRDLKAHGEERSATVVTWSVHGWESASIVLVEALRSEVRVEAYHLLGSKGLVVRTQTNFALV
jgi:hypothetical protein